LNGRTIEAGETVLEKRSSRGFDEVMIVNPTDPVGFGQGVRLMPYEFGEPPEIGYFAEHEPVEGYGAYAEDPYGYAEYEPVGYFAEEPYAEVDPYGYYAEGPEYAGWGEPDVYGYGEYEPVGYYGEEPMYGEADPYGYYGEPPEFGRCGEPDPYGEYEPVGYAEMPEMVGYGEYEPLAEEYPGYGEPDYAGYVRDVPSPFNAGCPLPTNVAGFGEVPLEGYVRPADVGPTCERFTPQPGPTPSVPDTFRPLW